jgi:SepF-like predicted cell division protein (DUF552 family)
MKKNNFQKGGFIYDSLFSFQDNPYFNLINTEMTNIKTTNKDIYNNDTKQFYDEPMLKKLEKLLLLSEIKSHELENQISIQEQMKELDRWAKENKITENENKFTIILEIRRYYKLYKQNQKISILNLLITEIKKLEPQIKGSNEEIYESKNWGELSLENSSSSSAGGGGGGGGGSVSSMEESLRQLIELRRSNQTAFETKSRRLEIIKSNIRKIDLLIINVKSKNEMFEVKFRRR